MKPQANVDGKLITIEVRRTKMGWASRWLEPGWEKWWSEGHKSRHYAYLSVARRIQVSRDCQRVEVPGWILFQ